MGSEFDAEEKERALRAESAEWDTSAPVAAEPGDIPTIDVAEYFATGSDRALHSVGSALRTACVEVGFHQLVGHGISEALQAGVLAESRRFHALPLEVKQTILMDRPDWPLGGVGYLPIGARKLPSRDRGNLNEAFLMKSDRNIGPDDNQWLGERELPGFRQRILAHAHAVEALALRLLPIFAVALELPPDYFAPAFVHPFWRLRLTHYPPAPPAGDGGFGIAPHVDTTFFTLLLQDRGGLNIFSHRRDCWIAAPVVPGAFVVNSGELLKQWSNDRVLSTRHFADNTSGDDRYSVPFFFNATADYPMTCLPSCHDAHDPPRYPAISYLESQGVAQGE